MMSDKLAKEEKPKTFIEIVKQELGVTEGDRKHSIYSYLLYLIILASIPNYYLSKWTEMPAFIKLSVIFLIFTGIVLILFLIKVFVIWQKQSIDRLSLDGLEP